MLLTCPACSARYEVPATALPAEGRVVRCTNCRAEWLARPIVTQPKRDAAPPPKAAPQPPSATAPQRELTATAPEAGAVPGPSAQAPRAIPERPAPPQKRGEPAPEPDAEPPAAPVREADPARALARSLDGEPQSRRNGGFVTGFAVVAVLALLATGTYIKQAEIAAAVPQLAGPIETYVAKVDQGRLMLERLIDRIRDAAG